MKASMTCQHSNCQNDVIHTYVVSQDILQSYCVNHAYVHGFCIGCGGFFGGIESFDVANPSQICHDCQVELLSSQDDRKEDYGFGDRSHA